MRKVSISAVLLSLSLVQPGLAGTLMLGQTYPIAEPDTLEEIKRQARSVDWKAWMRRRPADYGAFQGVPLPPATEDSTRLFDPTYVLQQDIPDEKGNVLIPKGTKVNVYDRLKLPGRYIIVGATDSHFKWLDEVAKPGEGDKIIVAGGNFYEQMHSRERRMYMLSDRMVERFDLRATPAIVEQEGNQLRITEYAVD